MSAQRFLIFVWRLLVLEYKWRSKCAEYLGIALHILMAVQKRVSQMRTRTRTRTRIITITYFIYPEFLVG